MGLVQHASGLWSSGTTITATFGAATGAGNAIIVCATINGSAISSIALTGSSDIFAQAVGINTHTDTEIWFDSNTSSGHTGVVVTLSGAVSDGDVDIYEWNGIITASPLDQTSSQAGSITTSFSSGTTATLSQANEVAFGVVGVVSTTTTITGPSSPWTNEAQLVSGTDTQMSGFQQVSATTGLAYSGTYSSTSNNQACIATFKLAAAAPAGTVQPQATVPVPRRKPARAVWQSITGQAFVQVAAPRQQPGPAPRRKPARAVWHGIAGAAFVQVPAPRQQPGPAPRRKPARAVVGFTPVTTTNAPPAPPGAEAGAVYYPHHHRGRGRTR
jgi:hypothetical protein